MIVSQDVIRIKIRKYALCANPQFSRYDFFIKSENPQIGSAQPLEKVSLRATNWKKSELSFFCLKFFFEKTA